MIRPNHKEDSPNSFRDIPINKAILAVGCRVPQRHSFPNSPVHISFPCHNASHNFLLHLICLPEARTLFQVQLHPYTLILRILFLIPDAFQSIYLRNLLENVCHLKSKHASLSFALPVKHIPYPSTTVLLRIAHMDELSYAKFSYATMINCFYLFS